MVSIPPHLSQPVANAAPILRYEQWLKPDTGEQVSLYFDGQQTQLKRGGVQNVLRPEPYDVVAAQAEIKANNDVLTQWDIMRVPSWIRGSFALRPQGKNAFVAAGFPLKLWDDIDIFQRALGLPALEGEPTADAYASSGTFGANGIITVTGKTTTTIDLNSAKWQNNLLIHPTAEIRQLYAKLNTIPDTVIVPPTPQAQAESVFHEQGRKLAEQGFIRMAPRRPDGTLWLPPALEPHRAEVLRLMRPVVRPYVKLGSAKTGKPALWDSKFGGMPYRLKGEAWPVGPSGKPLHFLAQIDLAEANKNGALPDLPRHGLLQFFLGYSDHEYEQKHPSQDISSGYSKVIYWPETTKDAAYLSQEVPDFGDDDDIVEMFSPPEHAMGFIEDTEIPSTVDTPLEAIVQKLNDNQIQYLQPNGHRLRGYPMVINTYLPPADNWQLLFQFDGDDYGEQLFDGNAMSGWLGFFVRGSDLKKLDFSKVRLEMDAF